MWGLLIGGLIFGIAGISAAVDDAKIRSKPYRHMNDGTPVYMDRKCNTIINGEKVIATYDYQNKKLVYAGQRSGHVYFDPKEAQAQRMHEQYSIPNLERAKKEGKLSYKKWYPEYEKMLNTEISTGKIIVELEWDYETNECRKYYYKGGYVHCMDNGCFVMKAKGDPGVPISYEEYCKLK